MAVKLTKQQVLDFLGKHTLMVVATFGDFPWIATVYYTFDKDLNLYFLSSPTTLHCRQIAKNDKVAAAIADSHQDINHSPKIGLQMYGIAKQISGINKVRFALDLWKTNLKNTNPKLTYKAVIGSMYKITPKRIKIFGLFKSEEGEEPVLEL